MYTGLSKEEFGCLASWLSVISVGQTSASPLLTGLTSGESTLTFSQKLLMVLMKVRQNLTQDDLACRFCIDRSSVSRIINH